MTIERTARRTPKPIAELSLASPSMNCESCMGSGHSRRAGKSSTEEDGMSEKLLKFLLIELKIARIICRHLLVDGKECGSVSEVSVSQLGLLKRCPVCGNELRHSM